MPKLKMTETKHHAEEQDRRLVDQVRELSLVEAGVLSWGEAGSSRISGRMREERRRQREAASDMAQPHRSKSQDASRDPDGTRCESHNSSRRPAAHSHESTLGPSSRPSSDEESRHSSRQPHAQAQGPLRRRSADGQGSQTLHQMEHQSSLRSLIASNIDTQREIEEFSRQIQEEGLLDGLDLDNIDLSEDSELSRRITAAYRRRQRQRGRAEPARRSNASATSAISRNSELPTDRTCSPGSGEGSGTRLRPSDASVVPATGRPASRRAGHARSASAASAGTSSTIEERARPPTTNVFLEPRHDRRRVRAASESRGESSDWGRPSASDSRPAIRSPAIRSTSALPTPSHRADSASSTSRPTTADAPVSNTSGRTFSSPDRATTNTKNLAFSARMAPITTRAKSPPSLAPSAVVPTQAPTEAPAESIVESQARRRARPADITVSTPPKTTLPPTSAVGSGSMIAPPSSVKPLPGVNTAVVEGDRDRLAPNTHLHNPTVRSRSYMEPSFGCSSCAKPHIQYEIHYNCSICDSGSWNICIDCYRARKGCKHWFGFGWEASDRWEKKRAFAAGPLDSPHILAARRYNPPRSTVTSNGKGQRIVKEDPEDRLQSGSFCSRCLTWANDCFWRCTHCNMGDWGFCNNCVNTGHCCTHPLLPLCYSPDKALSTMPSADSAAQPPPRPHTPNPPLSASVEKHDMFYPFRPLTFTTTCDLCKTSIAPQDHRLHCYECRSRLVADGKRGDYDICLPCYTGLGVHGKISMDNGMSGWRRCPKGHRMAVATFREEAYGRRRVVPREIVGGWGLGKSAYEYGDGADSGRFEKWEWRMPGGLGASSPSSAYRLVAKRVEDSAPPPTAAAALTAPASPVEHHPPDGGTGKRAVAVHGWWPDDSADRQNELVFPKGAEIAECAEINEVFWEGSYMGKVGIFPVAYVSFFP